ncbi:P2Y purinoceptor 3-like, partial [Salvelinus fontinalis]|uniref:P2Y purinoceptor 3-like n=1 Tax=Salvelinus fontinalis TaxID=8038 RepID=UPI0024863141
IVLYTAAISINLILGLPTNVYVLWLIVTGAGGTMASDFFSLNLSVSEILYILSNLMFICCICVERYLAVVHPVTFLKYKPLRYRIVLYTAAISINLILGLPTNVYVVWLIVTGAGGTMASDFFSLNLSVSEILYSLSNLMFIVHYNIQENVALWSVGTFFAGFNLFGRPLFQCCICVERYLAVVHPVTFLKYKPLRYRVGCCGVVWLMVLGSCFVNMFVNNQSAWWKFFGLIFNLLSLSAMLFCCLAVLWALKRPGPGEGERQGEGMNNMKLRAFRIISMITVSMIVNYFPLVLLL